jgi:hypothetical protein
MHKKPELKGAVFMSVSVQADPDEKISQESTLKFLQKQGATFTNLMLDEPPDVWTKKLGFDLRPCLYVFDREGKWRRFDPVELDEKDADAKVEKYIEEQLKKK